MEDKVYIIRHHQTSSAELVRYGTFEMWFDGNPFDNQLSKDAGLHEPCNTNLHEIMAENK